MCLIVTIIMLVLSIQNLMQHQWLTGIVQLIIALGFFARFGALGLLVMTAVIQIVMPTPHVHIIWALMLATILAHGGGALSLDGFIKSLRHMR